MKEQPTALRLAVLGSFRGGLTLGEVQEAEDELNRLVAQRDTLLGLLKEARKIIRATSSRNLVKDWDQRTTDAIKAVEGEKT